MGDVARHVFVLLSVLVVAWGLERCEASGKFSFEVHHLLSDAVTQTFSFDNQLPEKGSLEYFKVLAHRDRLIRGRGLASNNDEPPVTFMRGNRTLSIRFLGSLHYANVSVGTPPTWFLVALDTSSDLFWLPCNCGTTCISDLEDAGLSQSLPLNLYTPNASSSSSSILCSDKRCFGSDQCSSATSICPYQIPYSRTTVSSGTLFQDVLHLITEDAELDPVKANITLGCGQNQTGVFQRTAAVNGLLGLGMEEYSVPSVLAKANITANSFSMCFGNVIEAIGRISFGDKGYTDQQETPFTSVGPSLAYGVNVTDVSVGGDTLGVRLFAQFDTGSTFTFLTEPAYGLITKAFDDLVKDKRRPFDPQMPFEFCYDLSPNATSIFFPKIEMTFIRGSEMSLRNPLFTAEIEDNTFIYCLGILKNVGLDIIGQNLMSGYRIVFDRERMVLGWKRSHCFEDESLESSTPPPPEVEASPPPRSPVAQPPSPPPPPPSPPLTIPPPTVSRDGTLTPSTSAAASLIPLASQLLLLLSLMAFL